MQELNTFFQDISLRRRVIITVGMFTVITLVIGIYALIAIVETNKRLNNSVHTGQKMIKAVDTARQAQVHFKKQVQEWKDILLRGNDPELFEKHFQAFADEERLVSGHLHALAKMTDPIGVSLSQINESIRVHEELGRRYRKALLAYSKSDLQSAVTVDRMVLGIDREPTDRIETILDTIKSSADRQLIETETMAKQRLKAYQTFAVVLLFLLLAGVGFGIFSACSIISDLPKDEDEINLEGDKI